MAVQLNIGCGMTPTAGWMNYDNSFTVRFAARPALARLLRRTPLLQPEQKEFLEFCRTHEVMWADASRKIPHADGSVDTVYASHVFEHLDRRQGDGFLDEAKRVLRPGGVVRLAVPDIDYHVRRYVESRDADRLMRETYLTSERPRGIRQMLKAVLVGDRHHRWMYDGASLAARLTAHGFSDAAVMEPGQTTIADHGALNLHERVPESVFVEARQAGAGGVI